MAETNTQGLTAAQMGDYAQRQMEERVQMEAQANPNTLVWGAQTGQTNSQGMAPVPVNYGAMQQENPVYQQPAKSTYWEPVEGRYIEGDIQTDKPWEKYGLGSQAALYNTDVNTLKALQNRQVPQTGMTVTAKTGEQTMQGTDAYLAGRETNLQAEEQRRIQELRDAQKQEEEAIRGIFNERKAQLGEQQGEQQATQSVLSYRLGRKDTPYGVSEMAQLQRDQARVMNDLSRQESQLIMQSRAALKQGEYEVADRIRQEADRMLERRIKEEQIATAKRQQILSERKYVQDFGRDVLSQLAMSDIEPSQELFDWYDSSVGIQGVGQGIYQTAVAEKQRALVKDAAEARKADIDIANSLITTLSKVPVGTSVNIGGVEYTGLDRGTIKTFTEDVDGQTTFFTFNEQTKEMTRTVIGESGSAQDGWKTEFDSTGKPWRVNAKTGQMLPYFPSRSQEAVQEVLPEGSISPFTDASGNPRVQCGEFVNDLTGIGVGDSFESKMAKMDLWKKGQGDPMAILDQLEVGDVFTQKMGTWTGHVGTYLGHEIKDGVVGIRALESNYKPGVVTSSRFIPLSEIDGFGKAPRVHPLLQVGTDTPTFKTTGTASTKLSLADIETINQTLPPDKRLGPTATVQDAADAGYIPGGTTETGGAILSEKQRTAVAKSAEKKAIDSARGLLDALYRYKDLVAEHGFEAFGKNKTALESAYADLKIKYKDAAGLGALTGPDVSILEEAIKPATGFGGAIGKLTSGGNKGILSGIDDSIRAVERGAKQKFDDLSVQYDKYTADPYINSLDIKVRVRDKASGEKGTVPLSEFDETKYERY